MDCSRGWVIFGVTEATTKLNIRTKFIPMSLACWIVLLCRLHATAGRAGAAQVGESAVVEMLLTTQPIKNTPNETPYLSLSCIMFVIDTVARTTPVRGAS